MEELVEKFPDKVIKSLHESSLDDENDEYMVDNEFNVIKLDDFNKDYYQNELKCCMCLKGADAVFKRNDIIYVIEFKNCFITKDVGYKVKEKMYDSSIVLMDKLKLDLLEFRSQTKFIVVYRLDQKLDEESSQSLTKFKYGIKKLSSQKIKDYDRYSFGLNKLEKYLYKEVIAVPVDYFQSYLKEEGII